MKTRGERKSEMKRKHEWRIEKWFLEKTKAVVNGNKNIAAKPCRNNRK
jgi:hypothetical protein